MTAAMLLAIAGMTVVALATVNVVLRDIGFAKFIAGFTIGNAALCAAGWLIDDYQAAALNLALTTGGALLWRRHDRAHNTDRDAS